MIHRLHVTRALASTLRPHEQRSHSTTRLHLLLSSHLIASADAQWLPALSSHVSFLPSIYAHGRSVATPCATSVILPYTPPHLRSLSDFTCATKTSQFTYPVLRGSIHTLCVHPLNVFPLVLPFYRSSSYTSYLIIFTRTIANIFFHTSRHVRTPRSSTRALTQSSTSFVHSLVHPSPFLPSHCF